MSGKSCENESRNNFEFREGYNVGTLLTAASKELERLAQNEKAKSVFSTDKAEIIKHDTASEIYKDSAKRASDASLILQQRLDILPNIQTVTKTSEQTQPTRQEQEETLKQLIKHHEVEFGPDHGYTMAYSRVLLLFQGGKSLIDAFDTVICQLDSKKKIEHGPTP